ncbi:MAG: multicopper oxidase domain-containing protein [Thermoleophilia bacterium]|nr:multicopper oxidase domain-containing protein [Thermoleophilia bacterium]
MRLGTVEEWTLTNTTDDYHPFHIHVQPFQVCPSTASRSAVSGTATQCPSRPWWTGCPEGWSSASATPTSPAGS